MVGTLSRLKELIDKEAIIEAGLAEFIRVGEALAYIRDHDLYKAAEHPTFAAYCAVRWDFSKGRAYQLIAAAEVTHNLQEGGLIAPTSERVIRDLAPLTDEQQRLVWQVAQKTAPGGKVTPKHINGLVAVLQEVIQTHALNVDGEAYEVAKAFQIMVTDEEWYHATDRKKKMTGSCVYYGNAKVVKQDGAAVSVLLEGNPPELAAGQIVRLTIYTTE